MHSRSKFDFAIISLIAKVTSLLFRAPEYHLKLKISYANTKLVLQKNQKKICWEINLVPQEF